MVNESVYPIRQKHLIDMKMNIWFLRVFGVMPLDKSGAWNRFLSTVHCSVLAVFGVVVVTGNIFGMVRDWGDFEAIINNMISTVGVLSTWLKYIFLLYKRKDIAHLLQMLSEFENHQWPVSFLSEWSQIVTKTSHNIRIVTIVLTIYMSFIFLSWTVSPIITAAFSGSDPLGRRSHPYMTEYFFDHQTSPNYEFVYAFEATGVFVFSMSVVLFDALCVAFFMQAECQFRVMLASLKKVREVANKSPTNSTNFCDLEDGTAVSYGTSFVGTHHQQESMSNNVHQYLSTCIEHHVNVIRFVRNVDDVFNPIMLAQIMYSVFEIALSGLQATEKTAEFGNFIKFVIYATSLTFEVYLFCGYADNVLQLGQEVATVAYSCEWYDMDSQIKTMLQMITMRAQREVKFTAYRFKVLSIDMYGSLLNGSYSYFTLLKKLKNGEEI